MTTRILTGDTEVICMNCGREHLVSERIGGYCPEGGCDGDIQAVCWGTGFYVLFDEEPKVVPIKPPMGDRLKARLNLFGEDLKAFQADQPVPVFNVESLRQRLRRNMFQASARILEQRAAKSADDFTLPEQVGLELAKLQRQVLKALHHEDWEPRSIPTAAHRIVDLLLQHLGGPASAARAGREAA
jgi:hypothetical protein